jgi:hypothetical protein
VTERLFETIEERMPWFRIAFHSWRVWFVVALAGVILALILGYYNLQRTIRDEGAREEAAYVSCVQSIPILKAISIHFRGVNDVAGEGGVLVRNSEAVVAATPRSDPQYAIRKANLERILRAARRVAAIKSLPAPTKAECRERSQRLAR